MLWVTQGFRSHSSQLCHVRSPSAVAVAVVCSNSRRSFSSSIRLRTLQSLRKPLAPVAASSLPRASTAGAAAAALIGFAACNASHVRAQWVSYEHNTALIPSFTPDLLHGKQQILLESASKIKKPHGALRRWKDWIVHLVLDGIRLGQLIVICAPCAILLPVALMIGSEWFDVQWAKLMARSMQFAGPAFIKLGQWASTRSDLFAPTTCAALSTLHHKVAQEPWALTAQTVQRGLTAQNSVELIQIQTTPVGAGCIAQVHEAKVRLLDHAHATRHHRNKDVSTDEIDDSLFARVLTVVQGLLNGSWSNESTIRIGSDTQSETGEVVSVAIKVRRTGVRAQVEQDLRLLSRAAELIQLLLNSQRWFVIVDAVHMFSTLMRSQLDLHHEALNIEKFKHNFANVSEEWIDRRGGEGGIRFADCYLSTPALLVQSLEQGELLTGALHPDSALMRSEKARKRLADIMVKAFLKMVIVDSFCHSDLHPGNILVRRRECNPESIENTNQQHAEEQHNNNKSSTTKSECDIEGITFLDAGLCTELSDIDQRNFLDLFEAVALGRGEEAGRLMLQRSKHCKPGHDWPESCINPQGFVNGVNTIVGKVSLDSFRLSKVQIGSILQQIMSLVRKHNVELESNFTTLVISIVILEGVGRQLNPDLDIFQAALPVLLQANGATKIRLLRTAMERGGRANSRSSGSD